MQTQSSLRYFSPYPFTESETDDTSGNHGVLSSAQAPRIPGVNRATIRSHGRTSDLLTGGLGRTHGLVEKSILWVCDRCFKYMADGQSWELHIVRCKLVGQQYTLLRTGYSNRGIVPASILRVGKSISVERILFGKLTAQKKRQAICY